jgi:hypothetical protein
MAIKFNRSQTFATNGTVTASGLHNLVDGLDIYQALITDQTNLTSVGTADELLIADADLTPNDAPRAVTVQELFSDALTIGTYTDLNLTGNLTFGTSTGSRTISTNASITTGTINNATLGTTTGTAATFTNGTLTSGVIPTLTAGTTTSTAANVTTGTIGNLTTTLAGDFTISSGTGTLGTTGVTAGTYGTSTIIPQIAVDAKGRVTSVGTTAVGSTNKLLQIAETKSSSVITITGSIPSDNTKPQSTEGQEVLTVAITPQSATSTLYIEAHCVGNLTTLGGLNSALFKDSGTDAIAAEASGIYNYGKITLKHSEASGSTTQRTYKLRAGVGSGTFYINGDSSGVGVFNGTHFAKLSVMEVEA